MVDYWNISLYKWCKQTFFYLILLEKWLRIELKTSLFRARTLNEFASSSNELKLEKNSNELPNQAELELV